MLGYNRMGGYNIARYNAEGTELVANETLTFVDDTVTKTVTKILSELFLTADTTAKQQNKSVIETLNLSDWLRINRDDSNRWSD